MRKALGFFLLAFSALATAEDFTIQTFAGGGLPQNIQGTAAVLHGPSGIVTDASGNVFFTLISQSIVLKLDPSGVLTLVAGNGTPGFSGDGGLATNAQLNEAFGIALDGAGSLYIADWGNARIRKIQNGVISTIAGGGTQTADNVPAVNALIIAQYVAADAVGNVYVEDLAPNFYGPSPSSSCCRVRKVADGIITTIAGNGTFGYSGDGGPATSAQLAGPGAMAVDAGGALYFTDAGSVPGQYPPVGYGNIRKVQNGVITTVANVAPTAITVDPAGNLFIANGPFVQEISDGVTTTIAGTQYAPPEPTSIGEGGPAANAYLGSVSGLSVDKSGNLLITSSVLPSIPVASDLVRKISNGVITTVAGNATGAEASVGDGGAPLAAQFFFTQGNSSYIVSGNVAMDAAGNVYIVEFNRVRKLSQGVITTVAGTGVAGFSGDNGVATEAQLNSPGGIGLDAGGNLYIADQGNLRVRKVSNGIITTIAGNGTLGYNGDGGQATTAQLAVGGLAVSANGDVYVSDPYFREVVRKVSNGTIFTVAGGGTNYADTGSALGAQLTRPTGLALDEAGNLYIADTLSGRILEVSNGIITPVAGSGGAPGSSTGDGGPATSAVLNYPTAVAVDALGRLYIGEGTLIQGTRIRRVSKGIINTIAGNGNNSFSRDGGPATSASISPTGLAIGPNGQVYEADFLSSRVRVLTPVPVPGVSFSASPSPIPLNAGSTSGQRTLSWNAPGYSSVQLFANGIFFGNAGSSGSVPTGNWVNDGMNFFLVDPATGAPLSTVTVHTSASSTTSPVAFTANPSPITLAAGTSVGVTTLSWNAPGHSALQIWVDGVLFAGGLAASGSIDTGNWVSNGMLFSLMDASSAQSIATLIVQTSAPAGTGQVTFTASPNPITLAAGASVGETRLTWNAPGSSALQIWAGGVLFAASLPASGSIETGNWVSDGLPFSLVDPASGQTIANLVVTAK